MQYLSAYLLAQLSGSEAPSKDEIKKIITAAGAQFDEVQADAIIASLSGKNVDSLIAQGKSQLASVPAAGAGAGAAVAAAPAAAASAPAAKEAKKEEKKAESEEEMGFSLFD